MQYLGAISKMTEWSVHFQGKPFSNTGFQVYAPTSNAKEAEVEWFYEDLHDFLELTPKKRCPFHYRGLECKSRKSRNTWSSRQIWPWNTEWSRAKANRVLIIANTLFQQHKRRLYTWTSPDGWHQNQIDYILSSQRWKSSIKAEKQDQELTEAQIMNSLLPNSDLNWRKWGKTLEHSGLT